MVRLTRGSLNDTDHAVSMARVRGNAAKIAGPLYNATIPNIGWRSHQARTSTLAQDQLTAVEFRQIFVEVEPAFFRPHLYLAP
jgi:hypothetical protein